MDENLPLGATKAAYIFYSELVLANKYRILISEGKIYQIQRKLIDMYAIKIEPTRPDLSEIVRNMFHSDTKDPSDIEYGLTDDEIGPILDQISEEMIFCRLVNSYLTYLSGLAAEIITARPEILKSGETIRYDELMGFTKLEDIIQHISDKKITELSYLGINAIKGFFEEKMKLKVFGNELQEKLIGFSIEIRNILTHNNGIVNSTFKKRVPKFDYPLGEKVPMDTRVSLVIERTLRDAALSLDKRALRKFGLKPFIAE